MITVSLWSRAMQGREQRLNYAILAEARNRGWTPKQVRQDTGQAGSRHRKPGSIPRRPDVQPTEDGLAFWHADREQYSPGWPRESTGRPMPRYIIEGRAPTPAETWREHYSLGPAGYEAGDRMLMPGRAVLLSRSGRWGKRQDYRMLPCGRWVATGAKASPWPHDCRETPGYIDAMHEDAIREDSQRAAAVMLRADRDLQQLMVSASAALAEHDGRMPDLEAG